MGFFDSAQDVLDKGVSAAKGAVSGVAVEQHQFAKNFARLCDEGSQLGWHERNGGNLSYRLTAEEVASCRSFFYDNPSSWVQIGATEANLGGEHFLVKAAGAPMGRVDSDLSHGAGIVEIDQAGTSWRIVWGFDDGGRPTSEFAAHFRAHAVRKRVSGGADRVVYHAHPAQTVALSAVAPLDSKGFTRMLWKSFAESMVAFPQGVAVIPWTVPGGAEIAEATGAALEAQEACVWAQHGVLATGRDFDAVFGLVQTIEKACEICNLARAANGGSPDFPNQIPDEDLPALAAAYGLSVNEDFLS